MHLFAGSSHSALAAAVARELGIPLGKVMLKRFSSGECYVRYEESVRGSDVYILQSPGRDPDLSLMELLMMCQAAKLSFARKVHVVMPHFPYARQDRVAEPREPISAKLVADLLQAAGADHLVTMTLHSDQIQGFFSIPVDNLNARSVFADYFQKKMKLRDPVVVAPDVGGAKQAKKFADVLGADLAIMHKVRAAHQQAAVKDVVGDVSGRTCIVFDDIIDTAGSLMAARDALVRAGANDDVYVAASHAVFSGPALENLKKAGFKQVVVTDSIVNPVNAFAGLTVLSVAPLLAKVIAHNESHKSVTEIYGNKKSLPARKKRG